MKYLVEMAGHALIPAVFGVFLMLVAAPVMAAQLVMFAAEGCEWCEAWDEEVGVIYAKTPEARIAPLRRLEIDDPRPADLARIEGIVYTPTFVLLDGGREIGRIAGYPGEDHFWGLLGMLLDRLGSEN